MESANSDNLATLLRFLFLGNEKCLMISKRPELKLETVGELLKCIADMARPGNENYPFIVIKRVNKIIFAI